MNIYILTCNAYKNLSVPCVNLLNKYWPDQELTVVGFDRPDNWKIPSNVMFTSIGEEDETPWADRMIKFLKMVENEYFVFFLEDYFINQVPNLAEIERRFKIMRNNPEIGKMDLSQEVSKYDHTEFYKDTDLFTANNKTAQYLMSFQPAIWRREFFMRYLKAGENAWESEVYMSRRASEGYEGLVLGNSVNCMPYVNAVLKGKMNPAVKEMSDYNDIPGMDSVLKFNV